MSIVDYLLAHGWTPGTLIWGGVSLTCALLVLGVVALSKAGGEQVDASLARALPPLPRRIPGDSLLRDLVAREIRKSFDEHADEALAMVADPAAEAADKFTRAGWTEAAPGYWVKTPPQLADNEFPLEDIHLSADALAFAGSVLADLDDLTTEEQS